MLPKKAPAKELMLKHTVLIFKQENGTSHSPYKLDYEELSVVSIEDGMNLSILK
jgi:hypothetical protein